jgi:hypothetical protein
MPPVRGARGRHSAPRSSLARAYVRARATESARSATIYAWDCSHAALPSSGTDVHVRARSRKVRVLRASRKSRGRTRRRGAQARSATSQRSRRQLATGDRGTGVRGRDTSASCHCHSRSRDCSASARRGCRREPGRDQPQPARGGRGSCKETVDHVRVRLREEEARGGPRARCACSGRGDRASAARRPGENATGRGVGASAHPAKAWGERHRPRSRRFRASRALPRRSRHCHGRRCHATIEPPSVECSKDSGRTASERR